MAASHSLKRSISKSPSHFGLLACAKVIKALKILQQYHAHTHRYFSIRSQFRKFINSFSASQTRHSFCCPHFERPHSEKQPRKMRKHFFIFAGKKAKRLLNCGNKPLKSQVLGIHDPLILFSYEEQKWLKLSCPFSWYSRHHFNDSVSKLQKRGKKCSQDEKNAKKKVGKEGKPTFFMQNDDRERNFFYCF